MRGFFPAQSALWSCFMRNRSPLQRTSQKFPHQIMLDCVKNEPTDVVLPAERQFFLILATFLEIQQQHPLEMEVTSLGSLSRQKIPMVKLVNHSFLAIIKFILFPQQALFIDFLQSSKNHFECLGKATEKSPPIREHFVLQRLKAKAIDFGMFTLCFT